MPPGGCTCWPDAALDQEAALRPTSGAALAYVRANKPSTTTSSKAPTIASASSPAARLYNDTRRALADLGLDDDTAAPAGASGCTVNVGGR